MEFRFDELSDTYTDFSSWFGEEPYSIGSGSSVEVFLGGSENLSKALIPLETLLSDSEKQHLQSFIFETDRNLFALSHGLLRRILGNAIGIPPGEVPIFIRQLGKPHLKEAPLQFNLSHTKETFALALSIEFPVGIDIEHVNPNCNWQDIALRYFSEGEKKMLENDPWLDRLLLFYVLWTRKEAVLKAIGCGIVDQMDCIDTSQGSFLV